MFFIFKKHIDEKFAALRFHLVRRAEIDIVKNDDQAYLKENILKAIGR